MLTEEQVIAILSHDGDRVAMLNAAYHMGMMRAAEVCEDAAADYKRIGATPYDAMEMGAAACADDIRAEAGSTSEPRKWE